MPSARERPGKPLHGVVQLRRKSRIRRRARARCGRHAAARSRAAAWRDSCSSLGPPSPRATIAQSLPGRGRGSSLAKMHWAARERGCRVRADSCPMRRVSNNRWSRRELLCRGAVVLGAASVPFVACRAQSRRAGHGGVERLHGGRSPATVAGRGRRGGQAPHSRYAGRNGVWVGACAGAGCARVRRSSQAAEAAATVVGSSLLLGPIDAALVNGTLAHADETDDSHGASQSHPGAAVVAGRARARRGARRRAARTSCEP